MSTRESKRQWYKFKDVKVGDKVIYCTSSHYSFNAKELLVVWVGKDTFKVNVGSGIGPTEQNLLLFSKRDGQKYGSNNSLSSSHTWCEVWTEAEWRKQSERLARHKLESETKRARNDFISLVNLNINKLSKARIEELSGIINNAVLENTNGQS